MRPAFWTSRRRRFRIRGRSVKRLIPAIFAGAIIASLIVLLMIQLISGTESEPSRSTVLLPVETADPLTADIPFEVRQNPDCDRAESEFSAKLAQSQSCETDEDCAIAYLGCPFGCATGVNRSALDDLSEEEAAFQQKCRRCVYSCAAPLFEWSASCVQQRCVVQDRSVRDFEQETLEPVNVPE